MKLYSPCGNKNKTVRIVDCCCTGMSTRTSARLYSFSEAAAESTGLLCGAEVEAVTVGLASVVVSA